MPLKRAVGIRPHASNRPVGTDRGDVVNVTAGPVRGRVDEDDEVKILIGGKSQEQAVLLTKDQIIEYVESQVGEDLQILGYGTRTGVPTALVSPTWVTVFSETDIDRLIRIKAATFVIAGGLPLGTAWRIRASPNGLAPRVLFPPAPDTANSFPDGVEMTFSQMIQIPDTYDWEGLIPLS